MERQSFVFQGPKLIATLASPGNPVYFNQSKDDFRHSRRVSRKVYEKHQTFSQQFVGVASEAETKGFPTPQMIWEKLEPEQITLPVNMDGGMTGSVQIANVSAQTSGLYRCSVSNPLGTQHCYVNLSVYSPADHSPGILQGVMLSLTMALLLLALMVLALWLHRSAQESKWRNSNEDECYNEIKYTPSFIKRSFV